MTPFAAIVGGGLAGLGGATLAHVATAICDRLGSESWLRGPYGPPFFNISLYTGLFYGAIGGIVAGRRGLLAGTLGPFFGIVLPMAVLTRVSAMGMGAGAGPTLGWGLAVTIVYMLAIWGTITALGALAVPSRRGLGAATAVAASFGAYLLLSLFIRLAPSYARVPWNPTALVPSPINLMDGLLTGAAMCLAAAFISRRIHARQDHAR